MPNYYKAWDKFAKDLDENESDEDKNETLAANNPKYVEPPKPQSQAEMFKPTSGAKPNTQIVVKGARLKAMSMAEEFKSQGNSYFVSLEYSKAIECYSRCIRAIDNEKDSNMIEDPFKMKMLVLSNRA